MAGVSMKDIKLRIRSMESTKQITKAMEMVASSKLRRAQERVLTSRPYFEALYETVTGIAAENWDFSSPYVQVREEGPVCEIVIAGDRGLAGGYNHNVIKLAQEDVKGKDAAILPVGKKALEYFRSHGHTVISDAYAEAAGLTSGDCFSLAKAICDGYRTGKYSAVRLVYTSFVSVLTQTPYVLPLLPLPAPEKHEKARELTLDTGCNVGRCHLQVISRDSGQGADDSLALLGTVGHGHCLLKGVGVRLETYVEGVACAPRLDCLLKVADETECKFICLVDVDDIHTVQICGSSYLCAFDIDIGTRQGLTILVCDGTGDPPFTVILRIYAGYTCRYKQCNEHQKSVQSFH